MFVKLQGLRRGMELQDSLLALTTESGVRSHADSQHLLQATTPAKPRSGYTYACASEARHLSSFPKSSSRCL